MTPGELASIEARREALLGQLRTAEASVRAGLHAQGFGHVAHEHLERAMAHIQEAHIAINECKPVRTVTQLVDDLNRVQQVIAEARQRTVQRP